MGIGMLVAKGLPPPDKLKKRPAASMMDDAEPDADDEDVPGEVEAGELSAMQEFENAESTEEKAAALKKFIAICRPEY